MTADILLIEDTPSLQLVYQSVLKATGHRVASYSTAAQAQTAFYRKPAPLVILDLMLPDRDGIALMRDLLAHRPDTVIIVITANRSVSKAVEAMRAGAHDFLVKPFDEQRFLVAVDHALRSFARRLSSIDDGAALGAMVGQSSAMRAVYRQMTAVSGSDAPVFITGETGTGKELCARTIHAYSHRAEAPFIAVNCAAGPREWLEAEIFGPVTGERGEPGREGALDRAAGGTLFLDEIGDLDDDLQSRLAARLVPLGEAGTEGRTDTGPGVRLMAATSRDPRAMAENRILRPELLYRLNVLPIALPPLRERDEDVILIAEGALRRIAREEGRGFARINAEAEARLRSYGWPGNVRELFNVIRSTVVLNEGTTMTAEMLPPSIAHPKDSLAPGQRAARPPALGDLAGRSLAEVERLVIEQAIALNGGSITKAARALGVAPSTIYRKMESWHSSPDKG